MQTTFELLLANMSDADLRTLLCTGFI